MLDEAKAKTAVPLEKLNGSFGRIERKLHGAAVPRLLLNKSQQAETDPTPLQVRANGKLAKGINAGPQIP
jgi:hypothetical protein